MGTRGKSSLIASIADFLRKNNFNVLSRQTGLIPAVTYNEDYYFLRRNKLDLGFDRPVETKFVLEYFQNMYDIDCLVIENNAISEYHMSKLSEYIKPHITVITTISPDHILDQGTEPKQTAKIFLNSLYQHTHTVFYTNHSLEERQMLETSKQLQLTFPIIYKPLVERDRNIIISITELLVELGIKVSDYTEIYPNKVKNDIVMLKKEMLAKLDNGKLLINLGSINDLLHTQLFIDEVVRKYKGPYYLVLNFREDREDRTWIFMNYILPKISESFDGVIIRSDHPAFTEKYIKRYIQSNYPLILCLTTPSFKDFKSRVIKLLPDNSKIIVLANTANDFGFDIIEHFDLFQDSYPVLKQVKITDLN